MSIQEIVITDRLETYRTRLNEIISSINSGVLINYVDAVAFDNDPDNTSGLTWAYYGGIVRVDTTSYSVSDGSVSLTDNITNYIEIDITGTPTVVANTTGFTTGNIALHEVVTDSGAILTSADWRAKEISPTPEEAVRSNASGTTAGQIVVWDNGTGRYVNSAGNASVVSGVATFDEVNAATGVFDHTQSTTAQFSEVDCATGTFDQLNATQALIDALTVATGTIGVALITTASGVYLDLATGVVGNLAVSDLTTTNANIATGTITQAEIVNANVASGSITNLSTIEQDFPSGVSLKSYGSDVLNQTDPSGPVTVDHSIKATKQSWQDFVDVNFPATGTYDLVLDFAAGNNFYLILPNGLESVVIQTPTGAAPGQLGVIYTKQPASGVPVAVSFSSSWNTIIDFDLSATEDNSAEDVFSYVVKPLQLWDSPSGPTLFCMQNVIGVV